MQSIRDAKPDWRPDAGPITVIGAGGAARAVVASLAAQGAREIRVVNRTLRARARSCRRCSVRRCRPSHGTTRADALDGVALLANATDQGMAGKPALDLALDRLPRGRHRRRPDLHAAAKRRCSRLRGSAATSRSTDSGMLLNQARPAFKAWFGVMPDITPELIRAIEATF